MRLITLSILAVLSLGVIEASTAEAQRRYGRNDRSYSRPVYRTTTTTTRVYRGPVRANRRVYTRNTVYVNNGYYNFGGGRSVVYRRPVINRRYYDFRVRPTVIVENYPTQPGYIWVSGHWNWNGGEWVWIGGHYAPDPAIRNYYDDGSWD
jgi:hypothetical protein